MLPKLSSKVCDVEYLAKYRANPITIFTSENKKTDSWRPRHCHKNEVKIYMIIGKLLKKFQKPLGFTLSKLPNAEWL